MWDESIILTKEQVIESASKVERKIIAKYKLKTSCHTLSIDDWYEFSKSPQKEEDIRRRVLLNNIYPKIDWICIDYICKFSDLSEDFIKELNYITSPLFNFDYYNEKYINIVNEYYTELIVDPEKVLNKINELDNLYNIDENYKDMMISKLCPCLDNCKIKSNRDSKMRKYATTKIDWNNIYRYQKKNISKEFFNKYGKPFFNANSEYSVTTSSHFIHRDKDTKRQFTSLRNHNRR